LSDTEYCVFARSGGVKLYGTVETKKKYYVSSCNISDKELFKHPTIKDLNIIKNLVINSSQENEIVLDCFLGSGTTLVAAKELNRHYIGFEINPEYHKIAVDRLNGISQKDRKRKDMGILDMFDFGVEDID
jgi:DNA modification methylase